MSHTQQRILGDRRRQLALGLLFGVVFGFLLQKGGVAKYHVLMGQLLLRDWTVIKVMATAILVGMLGVFTLHAAGKVELQVKPLRLAANIIGGLLFGVGFGLSAYCPGTNIAALGQGNLDALAVAAGLVVGSYIFALLSGKPAETLKSWGNLGKLMLPEVLRVRRYIFIPVFAVALIALLVYLEKVTLR